MKTLRLLLTENVDNLGIVGDVVEVLPGYARNFLMPRGLATNPTPGAIKRLSTRRAEVEKEMKKIRGEREVILAKLKDHELTMMRSANDQGILYGGVSQHDIAEALRGEGFAIDDRCVRIGEQIKRLDTYHIPIVLDTDLKCEIKLWVVSDKPREELATEAAPAEAPGEKHEKKGRRKDKSESESEAAAPVAEEKEKKGKKPKGDAAAAAPVEEKKAKKVKWDDAAPDAAPTEDKKAKKAKAKAE